MFEWCLSHFPLKPSIWWDLHNPQLHANLNCYTVYKTVNLFRHISMFFICRYMITLRYFVKMNTLCLLCAFRGVSFSPRIVINTSTLKTTHNSAECHLDAWVTIFYNIGFVHLWRWVFVLHCINIHNHCFCRSFRTISESSISCAWRHISASWTESQNMQILNKSWYKMWE